MSDDPVAVLVIRGGPGEGDAISLPLAPTTLGRDASNDIVVDHPSVSRNHASIHGDTDAHWIQDLGSANGTFVNGQRVTGEARRLRNLDRITVGKPNVPVRWVYMESRETVEMPLKDLYPSTG